MSGENTGSIGKARRRGKHKYLFITRIDIFERQIYAADGIPGVGSYFTLFRKDPSCSRLSARGDLDSPKSAF